MLLRRAFSLVVVAFFLLFLELFSLMFLLLLLSYGGKVWNIECSFTIFISIFFRFLCSVFLVLVNNLIFFCSFFVDFLISLNFLFSLAQLTNVVFVLFFCLFTTVVLLAVYIYRYHESSCENCVSRVGLVLVGFLLGLRIGGPGLP